MDLNSNSNKIISANIKILNLTKSIIMVSLDSNILKGSVIITIVYIEIN